MKITGELPLGKGGQLGGRELSVSSGLLLSWPAESLGASQLGGRSLKLHPAVICKKARAA